MPDCHSAKPHPAARADAPSRAPAAGPAAFTGLFERAKEATMGGRERAEAEAAFCASSWAKVHAIVRGQGYRGADAEDLTQAYFARFLERGDLEYALAWSGPLERFIHVSVRHFLSNERDRERARKRGGGKRLVSLDAEPGTRADACALVDVETPETLLERARAERAVEQALCRLRGEMERAGAATRLARVERYLLSDVNTGSYRRMADEWGVRESAARVAVHRLRRRLARLMRGATDTRAA
jgi:RNA polymerase sigma-70 factor (ECF subfamily)